MGTRFGEKDAVPVPRVRKATRNEREFLRTGNGPDDEDDERERDESDESDEDGATRKKRAKRRNISKLSDAQIDDATDRVIMGESIVKIAEELNVNLDQLSKKIKKRVGMRYMREWQQSVRFDCLRAEMILQKSLKAFMTEGDVSDGRLALDVLGYRAKVLSFGAVNPNEQSKRVAGLTREEIFKEIIDKL